MNRCVFKEEMKLGARIFYFRYCEPEPQEFDDDFVFVYSDEALTNMVMGCHVSKIIPLDEDVNIDTLGFSLKFLSADSFNKIYNEWKIA